MISLRNIMKHLLKLISIGMLIMLVHKPVLAVGTNAGTDITNTATADYIESGSPFSINSNPETVRVAEILDVSVVWQDASNVIVSTPDTNQVLTFLLTNTGNGNDNYTLTVQNNIGGDQFDPVLVDIYLDSNSNDTYEAGIDTQYIAGTNDPVLAADASISVFVINNIPAALNNADLGNSQLTATSNTGSGAPGTIITNAGEGNTDAVVGNSGGTSSDAGTYVVADLLSLVKSVVINDPMGGNQPVPGAIMTYTIVVTVTGSGTAAGVVITDPIPTNTTYVANSITLNTIAQTDASDSPTDESDYNITNAGSITVNLGDLISASPVQTITFDVTIN